MTPHILIIDDQNSLSRFIDMELRAAGYQVSINYDNNAELSIVRALNPDLIVLNWELRRASGFNICQQIRLSGNQVPIVVITAKDETSCYSALQLGVQTCLAKPFLIKDLIEAIKHHLKCENRREKCLSHD